MDGLQLRHHESNSKDHHLVTLYVLLVGIVVPQFSVRKKLGIGLHGSTIKEAYHPDISHSIQL